MPKQRKSKTAINNGLSDIVGGGFQVGSTGTQISQWDTLFRNERWYLISNARQLLSQMYMEHGLVQTLIDVPVDDAFRGGYTIKTKQLSPEQVQELEAEVERCELNLVVAQSQKWKRLFGGAAILILTGQDWAQPLDEESLVEGSPLDFRAIDMWELFYSLNNTSSNDPTGLFPDLEYFDYYGKRVHSSRVIRMRGLEAPSFIRPRLRGWGLSVVEALVRSINQYVKSNELIFEVLDEFKVDIFKIDGFNSSLLTAEGTAGIIKRIQLANQQKNFQNALSMDTKDEWDHKQLTFAGLAEMLREFRIQIASDLKMPLTKLFGLSAAGFSSGEDDIENYNAMVEGTIRAKTKYTIIKMLELKCRTMFGFKPEDLQIDFEPLRIMSSEQVETIKTSKLSRVIMALDKGLVSLKEAKEAINKDELLPVQVDTSLEEMPLTAEPDGVPGQVQGT